VPLAAVLGALTSRATGSVRSEDASRDLERRHRCARVDRDRDKSCKKPASPAVNRVMRITRYEVTRQVGGRRVAAYTVRIARRQIVLTRRLGSARMRLDPVRDAKRLLR
jgi:hypothetical protein